MKNLALLMSSALIFAACGSSNPGTTHPVVTVPGYDNKLQKSAPDQVNADKRGAFTADVDGKVGQMFANFTAGTSGTALFHVFATNSEIQDFDITNTTGSLPRGATLKRTDKNTWEFSWNPPLNFPSDKLTLNIYAHANGNNSQYEVLHSIGQNFAFEIRLANTSPEPKFKGISQDLTKVYQEGDIVSFFVDIQDPAAVQTKQAPAISASISSLLANTELAPIDGSKLVRPDDAHAVTEISTGIFRAYFILDTSKGLPWPKVKSQPSREDTGATKALACFDITAQDPVTKQNMEATDFCPQIAYASSKPTIAWAEGTQFILKAGTPAVMNLTIQAAGAHSAITYKNVSKGFSTWPGNPDFNCDSSNPASLQCRLAWTPVCSTKAKTYAFSVSASAGVAGSTRKAPAPAVSPAQTITVESDNCPAPAATVKTAAKKADVKSTKTTTKKVPQKSSATPVAKQGA